MEAVVANLAGIRQRWHLLVGRLSFYGEALNDVRIVLLSPPSIPGTCPTAAVPAVAQIQYASSKALSEVAVSVVVEEVASEVASAQHSWHCVNLWLPLAILHGGDLLLACELVVF
jgi:hypothetical protein